MKTRATLQTAPFVSGSGDWVAYAVRPRQRIWLRVLCDEKHADLKPGDTITVERHGSEWRAV